MLLFYYQINYLWLSLTGAAPAPAATPAKPKEEEVDALDGGMDMFGGGGGILLSNSSSYYYYYYYYSYRWRLLNYLFPYIVNKNCDKIYFHFFFMLCVCLSNPINWVVIYKLIVISLTSSRFITTTIIHSHNIWFRKKYHSLRLWESETAYWVWLTLKKFP